MEKKVKEFIKDYGDAVKNKNASIFIGAGVPKASGLSDWKMLLEEIADRLDLDVQREDNLIMVAQYHVNSLHGNRQELNKQVMDKFSQRNIKSDILDRLLKLPITSYWTTNYDTIIEDSMTREKVKFSKYIRDSDLLSKKDGNDTNVFKFHGDISEIEKIVLIKDDYSCFHITRPLMIQTLQTELVSKTFVFIGYSFNDPNLLEIVENLRIIHRKGGSRKHYWIRKKIEAVEFGVDEKSEDFKYLKIKDELVKNDFLRLGIHTIEINSHSELLPLFDSIYQTYNLKSIFISGSARDYGIWENDDATHFLKELSEELITNGYTITSGYAEGVGTNIFSGVIETLAGNPELGDLDDKIRISPLPKMQATNEEFKDYNQNNMIGKTGIVIFLFGNRYNSKGELENSSGVLKEFKIAKAMNKFVIPVASTGFASKEIFEECINHIEDYRYLEGFKERLLTTTNPTMLVNLVMEILNAISKGVTYYK